MATILLLNGPNLNLLGNREVNVYGHADLAGIEARLLEQARSLGHDLLSFQSNAEHELVERIQQCQNDGVSFILLNPAAFTHSSIAMRDALLSVAVPFIEIHLSNIFSRETFRHHSYFSDIAAGCLFGLGAFGYELALLAASRQLGSAGGA